MTPDDLAVLRQEVAKESDEVTWVKADINAAFEALDAWWAATGRMNAAGAMEAAAPGKFTGPQKRRMGMYWLRHKFNGGG